MLLFRGAGVLPQASHLVLAVHDVGRVCRRHAERGPPRRTAAGAAQKQPAAGDRLGRLVTTPDRLPTAVICALVTVVRLQVSGVLHAVRHRIRRVQIPSRQTSVFRYERDIPVFTCFLLFPPPPPRRPVY